MLADGSAVPCILLANKCDTMDSEEFEKKKALFGIVRKIQFQILFEFDFKSIILNRDNQLPEAHLAKGFVSKKPLPLEVDLWSFKKFSK